MVVTLRKVIIICVSLTVTCIAVGIISISLGTAEIGLAKVLRGVFGEVTGSIHGWTDTDRMIILQIRLPRVILAGIVGASLSVAGAVFQALFRNPLADPYILGISSGSAVGAILAIISGIGFGFLSVPSAAFCGALLTIVLVLGIGRTGYGLHTNTLLLAGVIVGAFFSAVILFLVSMTRDERVHSILFWLMGDFSLSQYSEIIVVFPFVIVGFTLIYFHAHPLNLIVTGEETALQLGVEVEKVKKLLLVCASLMTGAVVSVSGIIGFVGLIVPHMMRMMFGSDHRLLLPASGLFGISFLILADTMARTVLAPVELPVGVITAIFGAPFFVYLLRRKGI
ncbi:MAG: iron ABC transporter permease [Thermodesulfobacteriota bacterium]|nr:iron ABC transporter permease [Thermodesulfobacteriota bacterium]